METDERKLRILQAIIDDYILTAVPVGFADDFQEIRHGTELRHHPQ